MIPGRQRRRSVDHHRGVAPKPAKGHSRGLRRSSHRPVPARHQPQLPTRLIGAGVRQRHHPRGCASPPIPGANPAHRTGPGLVQARNPGRLRRRRPVCRGHPPAPDARCPRTTHTPARIGIRPVRGGDRGRQLRAQPAGQPAPGRNSARGLGERAPDTTPRHTPAAACDIPTQQQTVLLRHHRRQTHANEQMSKLRHESGVHI